MFSINIIRSKIFYQNHLNSGSKQIGHEERKEKYKLRKWEKTRIVENNVARTSVTDLGGVTGNGLILLPQTIIKLTKYMRQLSLGIGQQAKKPFIRRTPLSLWF